jgi:hypothetical protein
LAHHLVKQHLGHNGGNVQDVHDGELAEQKVHGVMEARIHVDENEHNSVAGYGNYKDQENEGKEKPGERSIAEQTEEDKVSIHGIIAPLHNSVGFTKDRGGYGRKMEKYGLFKIL